MYRLRRIHRLVWLDMLSTWLQSRVEDRIIATHSAPHWTKWRLLGGLDWGMRAASCKRSGDTRIGLACLTQKMNQNWHDKCDCYQLLSLRNSDIHMSSVHGVGCEVVTLSNMSRGESEFSWQLWLLSIFGFVECRHSHVINAWCWICNWYILKFVKWYVVR